MHFLISQYPKKHLQLIQILKLRGSEIKEQFQQGWKRFISLSTPTKTAALILTLQNILELSSQKDTATSSNIPEFCQCWTAERSLIVLQSFCILSNAWSYQNCHLEAILHLLMELGSNKPFHLQCITGDAWCVCSSSWTGMHWGPHGAGGFYLNPAWNEKFMQAYEQKWFSWRYNSPAFSRPTVLYPFTWWLMKTRNIVIETGSLNILNL